MARDRASRARARASRGDGWTSTARCARGGGARARGGRASASSTASESSSGTATGTSGTTSDATETSESESEREGEGERESGTRERGFVGRVVGALTPANWGFMRSGRDEGARRERAASESESESDSDDEDSCGAVGEASESGERESATSEGSSEEETDARRRTSGGEATTKKADEEDDERSSPRKSRPSWARKSAPIEPTPWLNRDAAYGGPFRDNIKSFLNRYAECDGRYTEVGIMGYSVVLSKGQPHATTLRIYEEVVEESERAHCDCCRCIGWVHHPVNKKQYHFIVHTDFKARNKPELTGKRICQLCCCAVSSSERKCSVCDEVDKECSILDHQTHLLHGMIHANGFGHLKRINGREAGSMALSGTQLMGLWETICYQLRAREVSVEDVSQKYGVELRLLNPVSRGATWYGTYGYIFGKGSFGNTLMTHKRASELLRKFPVRQLRNDFSYVKDLLDKEGNEDAVDVVALVDKYVKIFNNEDIGINTVGDLVNNVMMLQRDIRLAVKEGRRPPERLALHGVAAVLAGTKIVDKKGEYKRNITDSPKLARRPPPNSQQVSKKAKTSAAPPPPRTERARALRRRDEESPAVAPEDIKINLPSDPMVHWDSRDRDSHHAPSTTSRWSQARLNVAANACVLALNDQRDRWISRQEVRAGAREKGIGDTGLLDHILKTLNDRQVTLPSGKQCIVRRRQGKNQMEFTLEVTRSKPLQLVAIKDEAPTPVKVEPRSEVTPAKMLAQKFKNGRVARTVDELTAAEVDRDLLTLYHDVLESYKPARLQKNAGQRVTVKGAPLIEAARTLLDTKQFVKIYTPVEDLLDSTPASKLVKPAPNAQKAIRIIVTAVIDTRNQGPLLSGLGANNGKSRQRIGTITRPPPEMVWLPSDPTLGDLKRVASKAFRDLYVVLSDFKVTRVKGYEGVSDKTRLGWRKMHGAFVEVHGEGADLESEFRYQGGLEQWTVKCMCGTGDDDGERMIACDECGIWMHTRCVGIKDSAKAPSNWICPKCAPTPAVAVDVAPKAPRPAPRRRRE